MNSRRQEYKGYNKIKDTMVSNLEIKIQEYKDKLDFQIMNMERADIALGRE